MFSYVSCTADGQEPVQRAEDLEYRVAVLELRMDTVVDRVDK
jgi:hypothetical protein